MGFLGRATAKERAKDKQRFIENRFSSAAAAAGTGRQIVFADDARGTRLLFEKGMAPQLVGCDVTTVEDAQSLQRAVKEKAPDAVISDFHLGPDDGIMLLEEIRAAHPDAVLVLISAYDDVPPDLEALGRRGIDAVARKPWNGVAFVRMLQGLLETASEVRAQRRQEEGAWHQGRFIPEPDTAGD